MTELNKSYAFIEGKIYDLNEYIKFDMEHCDNTIEMTVNESICTIKFCRKKIPRHYKHNINCIIQFVEGKKNIFITNKAFTDMIKSFCESVEGQNNLILNIPEFFRVSLFKNYYNSINLP